MEEGELENVLMFPILCSKCRNISTSRSTDSCSKVAIVCLYCLTTSRCSLLDSLYKKPTAAAPSPRIPKKTRRLLHSSPDFSKTPLSKTTLLYRSLPFVYDYFTTMRTNSSGQSNFFGFKAPNTTPLSLQQFIDFSLPKQFNNGSTRWRPM